MTTLSHGVFNAKGTSRVVMLLTLLTSCCLAAQETSAQDPAADELMLEEVFVTARKIEENLQRTPLAITVFSGEALSERRIYEMSDLADVTPSLTVGLLKPGQPIISIRGISSSLDGAAEENSVIVFIDDVYVGRVSGMESELFDLERVEILRGPQGTLFGKNVIGGAIRFVTRQPSEEPEAALEATIGNLDALEVKGLAIGPLSDNLFGKIAFSSRKRDGYVESQAFNYPEFFPLRSDAGLRAINLMPVDNESVRGQLRWIATDRLEVNLTADYASRKGSGTVRHFLPGPETEGGFFFANDNALIPNYENRIRTNIQEQPGIHRVTNWGLTGRLDYQLTPSITLTSLSSLREVDLISEDFLATDAMAILRLSSGLAPFYEFIGNNDAAEDDKTVAQEFRLTSDTDGKLVWVAGLYYLNEKTFRDESATIGLVVSDGAMGLIDLFPRTKGTALQNNETESTAVYGSVTYSLTDRLRLTAGARYTKDKKKFDSIGIAGGLVFVEDYTVDTSDSWSAFTPRLSLDYQATDDIFLYASVSNGFKSGGWQGLAPTFTSASTPYNEEEAVMFETGARTEWFDRRMQLNATIFYTDYTDLQVNQIVRPTDAPPEVVAVLITTNAASAEIKGVELEFKARPTQYLTFRGSYTYLDTKIAEFFVPPGFDLPFGIELTDRVGNRLPNASKHSWNVMARYDQPLANGGGISIQGDYRYKGETFTDPDNAPWGILPSFNVLNVRLSYVFPTRSWEVSVWSNNLLEDDYYLHNFANIGSGWGTPAPPRTYGVTVSWKLQ